MHEIVGVPWIERRLFREQQRNDPAVRRRMRRWRVRMEERRAGQ